MKSYVVATTKDWNVERFRENAPAMDGEWHLVEEPEELTKEALDAIAPRYVFFPHWSWIVPEDVHRSFECVCFHMTDVPYGRGGSPLQNLIARGHRDTVLTALRMTGELDAGPVYAKEPLSLAGSAAKIFERASHLTWDMIRALVSAEPTPTPQSGDPTAFARRTPDMSALPTGGDLAALYDHIRMLDAPSYPHAVLQHGDFELHFTGAADPGDRDVLEARVTIRRRQP